jgi:hypothetical protein
MIQGHSNVPLLPEKKKKPVGLKKYVNFFTTSSHAKLV